jgi:hypothetical protein
MKQYFFIKLFVSLVIVSMIVHFLIVYFLYIPNISPIAVTNFWSWLDSFDYYCRDSSIFGSVLEFVISSVIFAVFITGAIIYYLNKGVDRSLGRKILVTCLLVVWLYLIFLTPPILNCSFDYLSQGGIG